MRTTQPPFSFFMPYPKRENLEGVGHVVYLNELPTQNVKVIGHLKPSHYVKKIYLELAGWKINSLGGKL